MPLRRDGAAGCDTTDRAPVVSRARRLLEQLAAVVTHRRLGQPKLVTVNVVYAALAVFIAVGRLGPEPFAS